MQQVLDAIRAEFTVDPHQLGDEQVLIDIETLLETRRRVDARLVALLQVANARDLTAELRGRNQRGWLVESQRLSSSEAHRLVTLARWLPARPQLADALATGHLSLDQAGTILRTVTKLPTEDRDIDEKILLEAAQDLDADAIRVLCRKTREAACTDEDAAARRERVYGSRYLKLSETFDGMIHLDAMLTPEQGAALSAAIEPLAQKQGVEDERSAPQRRADALQALAEGTLAFSHDLPEFNGEAPHVNAVIDYDRLLDELRERADNAAPLDGSFTVNGTEVTAQTARAIACDAKIIPVMMRGTSEVLDIGRATRVWPAGIRKALQLEDKGCGWPKCKMPLWACRIHHLDYWSLGGATSKWNGVHLCPFHHWLVHNRKWAIRRDLAGRIQVTPTITLTPCQISHPTRL